MEQIFELEQGNFSMVLYGTENGGMNMGRMVGSKDCTIITFPYCFKYSDHHSFKDSEEFLKSLLAKKLRGKRNAQTYVRKINKFMAMLNIPGDQHEQLAEDVILKFLSDEYYILPLFANTRDEVEHLTFSVNPIPDCVARKVGFAYIARKDIKDGNESFDDFSREFLKITIERELEELNALLSGRYYYASLSIGKLKFNLPIIYADKDSAIGMMKAYFTRLSNLPQLLKDLSFDPAIEYYGYSTQKTSEGMGRMSEELSESTLFSSI